nr:RagB/SusD family nutrient uptake outer membrane protein [Sunxiuqinia sp.]
MKKIVYILLVIFIFSCEDKLELSPVSQKNVDNFYKTENQFYQAVMGCYDGLQNGMLKASFSYMMTESRSDNAWQEVDYDDGRISRFTDDADLTVLNSAWAGLYNYIARCNNVIQSLEGNTELEADVKAQFEGEALFMRALFYFELVRFFGEVPLVDKVLSIKEGYA